jgi:glyoxylase-like metal-dependent hydrolase (beta-lactamase superfamily II)
MQIDQMLVTQMAVFCYLITDEESKEAALVDPAGDFELIEKQIAERGCSVKYIINTHGHWDHTSGNTYMMDKTGAKLLIHEAEYPQVDNRDKMTAAPFSQQADKSADVYFLEDGDIITLGKSEIKVINTPGHAPGSVCLYFDGSIITGDTLFTEGFGRTDLAGGSEQELFHSIREKILSLPDETVILPGHHYGARPTSTVIEQKQMYRLI